MTYGIRLTNVCPRERPTPPTTSPPTSAAPRPLRACSPTHWGAPITAAELDGLLPLATWVNEVVTRRDLPSLTPAAPDAPPAEGTPTPVK